MGQAQRRQFLIATGALLAAPLALAQQRKVLRVGSWIADRGSSIYAVTTAPFLKAMAALGHEEGRNFIFETETLSAGRTEAEYSRAYRELAARKVDIFLALGLEEALKSALAAAGTRPIVMVAANWDPLAKGYIASLARPGRNVTGVVFREVELTAKRFQLLKEMVPDLKAAAIFWDSLSADQWKEAQAAAATLGLRIHGVRFDKTPYEFDRALAAVPAEFRGAMIMLGSPGFALPERRSLPDAALRHRFPSLYVLGEYVEAGGLMSYGPNYPQMFARAADYVDRIAKGAKPQDLPIEQPTRFELVVNLKTAKALGIAVPPSIRLRADRVIE